MLRGGFIVGVALAVIGAVTSCEDTGGLSGGSDDADAAPDATTAADVEPPKVDAAFDAPEVEGGCDAAAPDPTFLSDAIQIDSSGHFVCAVRANGAVVCWGDNSVGQLGIPAPDAGGTIASSAKPVVVPGIPPATHVSAGYQHACAVVTGGEVWCWGNGAKGQTGIGGGPTTGPVQILGSGFTPLTNIVATSAGGAFTCALAQGGGVLCWGDNGNGQLGSPGFPSTTDPIPVSGLGVATSISSGFFHACAMTSSGAKCWGGSQTGELGRSVGPEGGAPAEYPTGTTLTRIAASTVDTCAIDNAGNAICSGYNSSGQLGSTNATGNINTPFPIPELSTGDVTDVDVGWSHTCGTRKDESAFCMSAMPLAALGRGPLDASSSDNAARTVDGLSPVAAIKVGGRDYGSTNVHTCALVKPSCAKSGQVWCWGANGVGQLGNGTNDAHDRPVRVVAP